MKTFHPAESRIYVQQGVSKQLISNPDHFGDGKLRAI
jgi:hypothetical protein